jgi:two-component system LytT family response regulator
MKKISAWIVDDEINAQTFIKGIIDEYCSEVEVIGTSSSADDAYIDIKKNKPQIVYLDINIPRGSGISILEMFPVRKFEVIVISAYSYNEKKIKQFRDVPFLLKPISIDIFIEITKIAIEGIKRDPNKVHRYKLLDS